MHIRYRFTLLLFGCVYTLFGQQLPNSMRMAEVPATYNSAADAAASQAQLRLSCQKQSILNRYDLAGSASLSFHSRPFGRAKNWTFGLRMVHDQAYVLHQNIFRIGPSVRVLNRKLGPGKGLKVYLGVYVGAIFAKAMYSQAQAFNSADPLLGDELAFRELDAGLSTMWELRIRKLKLSAGLALQQLPGNFASNWERGVQRYGHLYGHFNARWRTSPQLSIGPALAFHRRTFNAGGGLQPEPWANLNWIEWGLSARFHKYKGGCYLAWLPAARMAKLGFDLDLMQKSKRKSLSLAFHFGIPMQENQSIIHTAEVGVLWTFPPKK